MKMASTGSAPLGYRFMMKKKSTLVSPETATPRLMRGRDGVAVKIRAGFVGTQGRDGRMVAIPSGSGSLEGADGRVVAIPPGHIGIENAKGRVVPKSRW